jgi:hypothetical protein
VRIGPWAAGWLLNKLALTHLALHVQEEEVDDHRKGQLLLAEVQLLDVLPCQANGCLVVLLCLGPASSSPCSSVAAAQSRPGLSPGT